MLRRQRGTRHPSTTGTTHRTVPARRQYQVARLPLLRAVQAFEHVTSPGPAFSWKPALEAEKELFGGQDALATAPPPLN